MEISTNPFLNAEVNAPKEYQTYFQKYAQSTGASSVGELDRKPFPRMVDFWFLAICVAVKKGLEPVELTDVDTYKAIEGAAISSPEWRIDALKLIAVAESDDPNIVTDGRRMMKIANGLAFAGMPVLIEILEENFDEASLSLCDALAEILQD